MTLDLTESRPALLVIDMQNGSCHPAGSVARAGLDTTRSQALVPKVAEVLGAARAAAIPVLFTRLVFQPGHADGGILTQRLFPKLKEVGALVRDTWDAEIVDDLRPLSTELVVDKPRYSAFYQTGLEQQLRQLNVETLIFAGVSTNICVESTLRDAVYRDYRVVLVEDAVAERDPRRHEATILTVRYGFGEVVSRSEVIEALLAK